MTIYGNAASGTDTLYRASGTCVDAGVRRFRNVVSLAAEGGGTTEEIVGGIVREGCAVFEARMHASVDLSAINFTIGTAADNAKYGAAQAGPNATSKTFVIKIAELAADALSEPETINFYPSAALPAAGSIVTEVFASKR